MKPISKPEDKWTYGHYKRAVSWIMQLAGPELFFFKIKIMYFNIKTYISIDHIVYALYMEIAIIVIY